MKKSLIWLNHLVMWIFISLMILTTQNVAQAQTNFGVAIAKTCPGPAPVPPGTVFQCTFSVQNQDPENNVIDLAITNTAPFPGGSPIPVACKQAGFAVTTLGPLGTVTDTCTGAVFETAPACGRTDFFFFDRVEATGIDVNGGGTPIPVSGSVVNSVLISACCQRDAICLIRNILLIKAEIILLPGELFPAPGNRQALLSGLDSVLRKVEDLKFDDASHILGDLRKHLDGCASADDTPDRNDWINSCEAQTRILSLIDELIAELAEI